MKRMTIGSYLSPKQFRHFITAVMLVMFTFTLTAQFFNATLAVDAASFDSGPIISKDAHSEDTGRVLDVDTSLDALFFCLLFAITALPSAYLSTRNLFVASLFSFSSASPRGPPTLLA